MRITLLGTGGPRPDPARQGPATLVTTDHFRLLFDAGRGVATQLAKVGVRPGDLDTVFITHHHFDHIGGLGDLLMAEWNGGRQRPLIVRGPVGTTEIVDALFTSVYWRDIDFRIAEERHLGHPVSHPRSIIDVADTASDHLDLSSNVTVTWDRVEHGSTALVLDPEHWTALGYRIGDRDKIATVSGDAVVCPELVRLAADADILVMCAYLAGDEISSDDDRFLVEQVIAGAPQAAAVATAAGARHLVLTHIREKSSESTTTMAALTSQSFSGQVTVGEDLMNIDVSRMEFGT